MQDLTFIHSFIPSHPFTATAILNLHCLFNHGRHWTRPINTIPKHFVDAHNSSPTVRVSHRRHHPSKGDTGNLKFSVQFSIQDKHIPDQNNNLFNFLGADVSYRENENHSCQNSSFSSYVTPPNDVQEVEDQNSESPEEGDSTRPIVTRLRSGVISPVNYFPRISSSSSSGLRPCERKRNGGKNGKNDSVFERVLRRHRSPIRPCTSYAFFVMATWGFVKSSSFGETSKQLGRMWCQLPPTEKRFYKEMAMKDTVRYKRQCMQLMKKPTQSTARR